MDAAATKRILEGPLPLEIARFGVPVALGMGLQVTFNLVDAYLVSRLQPEVAGPALGALASATSSRRWGRSSATA